MNHNAGWEFVNKVGRPKYAGVFQAGVFIRITVTSSVHLSSNGHVFCFYYSLKVHLQAVVKANVTFVASLCLF